MERISSTTFKTQKLKRDSTAVFKEMKGQAYNW